MIKSGAVIVFSSVSVDDSGPGFDGEFPTECFSNVGLRLSCGSGDAHVPRRKRVFAQIQISSDEEDEELLLDSASDYSSDLELSLDECDTSDDEDLQASRKWTKLYNEKLPPPHPRFPFLVSPGMTATVQDERNPLEFFELFFDDEVIALIVQETNRYALQFLAKHRTTDGSRAAAWKLLTAEELKVFLALILLQGIIDKPELAMYWSTRRILQTPIFGELMSKNRFHLIMKFLHFSDNEDEIDESQHP
ncbi:hypothetical protein HPB47_008269 [Ixodes persulcatus]|uniref:Uncharacterized protein n=1 Tax=Ixodes persulcatus TaxID=34615 RepID=A0AC60P589_IXOPE|nr:hypothetical protein HPB47_008269 [Ixodes persulcatus]